MAELMLFDTPGAVARGQAIGTQQRLQRKAEQDDSALNRLAQLASTSGGQQRQDYIAQAMGVDRAQGAQLAQGLGQQEDRRTQSLVNMARLLTNAPAEARAGLYQQMRPSLSQMGFQQLPPVYDDTTAQLIDQSAQAVVQAYAGGGDAPSQQRYAEWLLSQVPEEDRDQALGVLAGTRARPATGGFGFEMIKGADGRERMGRTNPRTGVFEVYDESTGNFTPLGGGSRLNGAPPGMNYSGSAGGGQAFYMTDDGQRIPQSEMGALTQAIAADARGEQFNFPVSAPPQGGLGPRLDPVRGGYLGVGPSAAEEAGAKRLAETNVDLATADARARAEAQIAGQREAAVQGARGEAERAEQAPKRIARYQQALDTSKNVQKSIENALGMIGTLSTGFLGARSRGVEGTPAYNLAAEIETIKANLGFDRLQQMRDNSPTGGALGQVAIQELVALQSTIANLDPNQSADQLRANLERIQDHYTNWASAVSQALAEERSGAQAPTQPASSEDDALIGKYL